MSTTVSGAGPAVEPAGLGATRFTFRGDRTEITYFPTTPGPLEPGQEGGKLTYTGPERPDGSLTVSGSDIERVDGPAGTTLTVVLRPDDDTGSRVLVLLVPAVLGLAVGGSASFATVAILAHGRGFAVGVSPSSTYSVLPLSGEAVEEILPEVTG